MTDPSSPAGSTRDPDALIARAGVAGDPNHDQHFLVDDRVLDRLPEYLLDIDTDVGTEMNTNVSTDVGTETSTNANADTSHVFEVGAGTGVLTDRLLGIADHVTAVERDPDLASFLREEFADAIREDQLTIIEGDALDIEIPDVTASVSNLPYGVSSEIVFRLLPLSVPLVVMLQREFAERMAAEPNTSEYGRLSVTAGHYAQCEIVEPVPREAFSPPPAVESAVVRVTPRDPDYEVPDDEFFLRFVTAVFTQRRKTMRNAIRNTAHISMLDDPDSVVTAANEDVLDKRAGKIPPETFAELARLAWEHGEPSEDEW
jgi:16S rRNA (adenine1518-N6/adenine1519-N6)-dimethyltransferase